MKDIITEMKKVKITIDLGKKLHTIEGWGTSLCWFGHVIGGWSNISRNTIADLLFSKDKGLGLNLVRYNIWGGDNPLHKHMRIGSEAPGFLPQMNVWNWDIDENQRWMLMAAKSRGADLFEAFSNSPPYWMTYSQCSAGAEDGKSNLKEEYYEAFADYLTEVIRQYRNKYGLIFQTLDPLNEPYSSSWKLYNRQEGCHFNPAEQMKIIKEVKKKLDEKQLYDTQISAPDENSIDVTVDSFKAYDNVTKDYVKQINAHSYEGTRCNQLKDLARKYGKRLWMSEYGSGGNTAHDHNSILPALDLAAQITKDLREMQPSAWVYWQAVEDEKETIEENGNWGFIHADMSGSTEEFHITKKYYAMCNFSRFIKPGYVMLDTDILNGLAFYSEEERQIVIVIHNTGNENLLYTFSLITPEEIYREVAVYRTSCHEDLLKLPDVNINHSIDIISIPQSITTYVFRYK